MRNLWNRLRGDKGEANNGGGLGLGGVLLVVFIVLKLCHVIAWSWVWVLSPLWISVAAVLAFFLFVVVIIGGIKAIIR